MSGPEINPRFGPSASDLDPGADQLAFAAYEDAWRERDSTGSTSSDLLIAALQGRDVPARKYAPDTRLHRALFDSWERGRHPKRMHGVILKYRFSKLRGRKTTGDDPSGELRLPPGLRPANKWGLWDEEKLPFRPTGLFTARVGAWHDTAEDDDDDDPQRAIPVWLDTISRPEQTPVMVGRELAGHTDLPDWVHQQVVAAAKRGRRTVVTGDLWIERCDDGSYRTKEFHADLPKRKG